MDDSHSESMPAGSPTGLSPAYRPESVREEQARANLQAAGGDESRIAYSVIIGSAVPILVLLLISWLNAAGVLDVSADVGSADTWARSTLCLVLLLAGVQLVSVLLVLEHRAYPSGTTPAPPGRLLWVWVARGLVLAAVVAALVVARAGAPDWVGVAVTGLVVEAVTIAWVLAARSSGREREIQVQLADAVPAARSKRVDLSVPEDPQLLAVGASGGGIRATAFVLGGHQATQAAASELRTTDDEPHMFAVSGGSYMAAALALRRRYKLDGSLRDPASSSATAYALGSPELERLRRHTRYLFEPKWRTREGIVSLLIGAVVNLAIVGLTLRLVSWMAAHIAVSVGLVVDCRVDDRAELIDWSPGLVAGCPTRGGPTWPDWVPSWVPAWDWLEWWPVYGPPILCLVLIFVVTVVAWRATAAFDGLSGEGEAASDHDADGRERAIKGLSIAARVRIGLLFAGLGWLVVVLGLPAAAVGLSQAATNNEPTSMLAGIIRSSGFGTDARCEDAFVERVTRDTAVVNELARLSPGTPQEVSTGACGRTVTVTRIADTETLEVVGNDPSADALRALVRGGSMPGEVIGVGAALAVVTWLLRRGPTPQAAADATWRSRAKRVALTWLPLLIMAVVGVYLLVLWTFGFLVGMNADYLLWAVILTIVAYALAALIDANAISLHGFYRSRLSDAFAVGVDEDTSVAEELPPARVYRFSELQGPDATESGPRLHIVTTLNSRKANEAPSMRGGFPMVFGAHQVEVHREQGRSVRAATSQYENFAGAGQVSIMAAVAISGAAISPLTGRYGAQMAPYRLLLALFNVRVGAWVRNPEHTQAVPQLPPQRPRSLWMTARPGLVQVALEAFGSLSANQRWIYLSDGGHLDNTGLVECVRHCVNIGIGGRILVLDASNDPVGTWSAVGDAIAVVRADLNIDLRRDSAPAQPPWMRRYKGGGLDVVVVKAVRTGPPTEDPDRARWWEMLPPNVQSFSLVNADFPRASTARQRFGDLEFEAYRGLGFTSAWAAMAAAGWLTES